MFDPIRNRAGPSPSDSNRNDGDEKGRVKSLQERVHKLLYESLRRFGVLGLGRRETLGFTPFEKSYEVLDEREKLYRRNA